jgi:hypothetical protein
MLIPLLGDRRFRYANYANYEASNKFFVDGAVPEFRDLPQSCASGE